MIKRTTAATVAGKALDSLFTGGRMLCDGAMGTMLSDRICMDRCYDELNVSQPETVASIHAAYLESGAEMIETNTFGANVFRLERHGLRDQVREINLAGVKIARRMVAHRARASTPQALVAGAIGPLGMRLEPYGRIGLDEARAAFAEQILPLSDGGAGIGVDLLTIETMTSLAEAAEAIRAARDVAPGLRIVVMMTVGEDGNCLDGASPEVAAARLTELGADAVGCNCSTGPASVLDAIERMRAATHLPLAAMPNAGLPSLVEGRHSYRVTPEEMADFARKYILAGTSLIGGCCGTTPNHTRAMKFALRALATQAEPQRGTHNAILVPRSENSLKID